MLSVADLQRLYDAAMDRKVPNLSARFDPFICHQVVTGGDFSAARCVGTLAGTPGAILALPDEIWRSLPLKGLRPSSSASNLHKALLESLHIFGQKWPWRQAYINDWISLVQWVEQDPLRPSPLLTSSTFPALPHCAFMSSKALRHIPPDIILESDSQYALFENLFHEALHQQLSSTILFSDSVRPDFSSSNCKKIPVPWRSSEWEPDRVLHATFVYSELLALRLDAQKLKIEIVAGVAAEEAATDAQMSLLYLCGQFAKVREVFSENGQILVEEVRDKAERVLSDFENASSFTN